MKAQLGDYIWLYGRRRVIVKIEHTIHGGHCYYGVAMTQGVGLALTDEYNLQNFQYFGQGKNRSIYWIRSDRLKLFDGQALRTGKAGKPKLEYRLGRKRS